MAKKKTIDLRSLDPTPVPAGDVNIIYNGVRIGGFSDDTEATLKTGGCRVEHDINVNYTKPPGGNTLIPVTFNNSSSNPAVNLMLDIGAAIKTVNDNPILAELPGSEQNVNDIEYIIPGFRENNYEIEFSILDPLHELDVTINNVPSEYTESRHYLFIETSTYPESVTISVTDKAQE